MNVFMMIIMTAMFGAYQYFMTRRTEGDRFDREEMALRVEVNCLRRFHDFAAGENEQTLNLDKSGMPGIGEQGYQIEPPFSCAGSGLIRSYKYCLDEARRNIIHCADVGANGFHCVATTKNEVFPPSRRALLFKMKMSEVREGMLGERPVPQEQSADGYGMSTCVPALKAEARRMGLVVCAPGTFSRLRENGEFECAPVPKITPCTAHEEELDERGAYMREGCTETTRGKAFCCAREPGDICGMGKSIRAVWVPATRSYRCVSTGDACPGKLEMMVQDELGDARSTPGIPTGGGYLVKVAVAKAFTARYDEQRRVFDCVPNQPVLAKKCRETAGEIGFFYVGIENARMGQTPVCRLSSTETTARAPSRPREGGYAAQAPERCAHAYQVRQSDGQCYTRWCIGIPRSIDVKIGRPNDADCSRSPTHPYMAYNNEEGWNCVYCTRLPPQ